MPKKLIVALVLTAAAVATLYAQRTTRVDRLVVDAPTSHIYFRSPDVPASPNVGDYYVAPTLTARRAGGFDLPTQSYRSVAVNSTRIFALFSATGGSTNVYAFDHLGARQTTDDMILDNAVSFIAADDTHVYGASADNAHEYDFGYRGGALGANLITNTGNWRQAMTSIAGFDRYGGEFWRVDRTYPANSVWWTGKTSNGELGTLADMHDDPAGMAVSPSHLFVGDSVDLRVNSYTHDMMAHPMGDFTFAADITLESIAYHNGFLYLLDDNEDRVLLYEVGGSIVGPDNYEPGGVYRYDGTTWQQLPGGLPFAFFNNQ